MEGIRVCRTDEVNGRAVWGPGPPTSLPPTRETTRRSCSGLCRWTPSRSAGAISASCAVSVPRRGRRPRLWSTARPSLTSRKATISASPAAPTSPSAHGPRRRRLPARFLIRDRDRDGKFPVLSDSVLNDAGIEVVLSGVRMPRMNSITERWVQTCRRELLDCTLMWNQWHLRHALREFEDFYNSHRPHRGMPNARPLHSLPTPISDLEQITHLDVPRRQRLGGILDEYHHVA